MEYSGLKRNILSIQFKTRSNSKSYVLVSDTLYPLWMQFSVLDSFHNVVQFSFEKEKKRISFGKKQNSCMGMVFLQSVRMV